MRMGARQALSLGALLCCAGLTAGAGPKIDFSRDIQPILSRHCAACHGFDRKARKAGLRLDLRDSAVARKAIVPGNPGASKLIARIESTDEAEQMPPADTRKPLGPRQKQLLRAWIEQGAPYARHWAFVPPGRSAPPAVKATRWVRNPIDAFVLARLEREKLSPSAEADRATLLRRVTLDLTGLPPTLAELDAFLADRSPDAYEKVVDRLLASPRYAERMALAWLDAARYADTNGFNNDEDRTQWPWRDWVLDAFAQNMPYDRFLVEQLAGDLLPGPTRSQKVATGFHRNQVHNTEGGIIAEEYRVEYVADRVHTTATVFLGLSMQCARCHDHKYDPISQREYYQFFAFFNSVSDKPAHYANFVAAEPFLRLPSPRQQALLADLERRRQALGQRIEKYEAGVAGAAERWEKGLTPQEVRKWASTSGPAGKPLLTPAGKRSAAQQALLRRFYLERIDREHGRLRAARDALTRQKAELEKGIPAVMVMQELPAPRPTFVLKRGQYDQPGERVSPAVPGVLPALPAGAPANRLGLAHWLVDPANPLTARVAVNRWWQMLFGNGLVKTVEDFGATGEVPSHPELLDFLAVELVAGGWDVKALLRRIVTSATYRQSSRLTSRQRERDPDNRLLGRGARYRLPAEMVRDNALTIAGLLRERQGGPSVKPYQPAGLWEDVTVERRGRYVADRGDNLYRRSLYTFWKRTCPPPALMSFDAPNREVCVARRAVTNTPLQALVLLNDPTYVEAARKLAERMLAGGRSVEASLTLGFRTATARPPTPAEQALLQKLHRQALARFRADREAARKLLGVGESGRDRTLDEADLAACTAVASVLLNLDETITRR